MAGLDEDLEVGANKNQFDIAAAEPREGDIICRERKTLETNICALHLSFVVAYRHTPKRHLSLTPPGASSQGLLLFRQRDQVPYDGRTTVLQSSCLIVLYAIPLPFSASHRQNY